MHEYDMPQPECSQLQLFDPTPYVAMPGIVLVLADSIANVARALTEAAEAIRKVA